MEAHARTGFPATVLRLPMVISARDQYLRLYNYVLRLRDGGPVLIADQPDYPVRNVYAHDVVRAIMRLLDYAGGFGRAFNISPDETLSLSDLLHRLAHTLNVTANIVTVPRSVLIANGFLPDCSPFSDVWMSELDNTRSKVELGMTYTPVDDVLRDVVDMLQRRQPKPPAGYRRRNAERALAASLKTPQ